MSYYGERVEKMSVEEKDAARDKLGLNDPIHIQYIRWIENAAKGDFGISFKYKQDVMEVIGSRIGFTLILGGIGFVLTFVGALLLGVLCAWYEDKWVDKVLCKGGTLLSCIPEFWLSLVLILVFAVTLHLLPSSGAYDIGYKDDVLNMDGIIQTQFLTGGFLFLYGHFFHPLPVIAHQRITGSKAGDVEHCYRKDKYTQQKYQGFFAVIDERISSHWSSSFRKTK